MLASPAHRRPPGAAGQTRAANSTAPQPR